MRSVRVLVIVVAALAACTQAVDRPPVKLSLQLATRQSCGVLSGLDYDTSCLAAVSVRVFDAARAIVFERCEPLAEPREELRELLRGAPVLGFGNLSTQGVVTFEVRGLHDKGDRPLEELCSNGARDDDDLLFWGESAPVDLAAFASETPPSPIIRIFVDCRDCTYVDEGDVERFGCTGIVDGVCDAQFPDSFCVPTVGCDKPCDDDDGCFEGARTCAAGRCDVSEATGTLCSPCNGLGTCSDGFACLERPGQPPFCAAPCPDAICPTGTKCNRLGNDLDLSN